MFTQGDRSLARSEGGLGIGLTLVKELVEMHGGKVEAFSDGPNHGSEFVVHLPLSNKRREAPCSQPSAESVFSRPGPRRILVVDDNQDSADSLARLLKMEGHEVITANDGPTALDMAMVLCPSIILLDIGLPKMDGYEVARRIRKHPELQAAILVALTGYGQEEDRRRAQEAGFHAHLVKPAGLAALRALLAETGTGGR